MATESAPKTVSFAEPKRLSYLAYAGIVIGYLAIIQVGGLLLRNASDPHDELLSVRDVVLPMTIPLGAALLFTYGAIHLLGWWGLVFHETHAVRRWVWVVPIVFIVGILIAIDYSDLANKSVGYVLVLLLTMQLVGWGEEGMFRGIGVVVLRQHGLRESQVALWSSLIFGSVHLTNAIGRGASAIPQAIIVSLAGYYFYLIRRVSRSNWLNSVLHGMFDFSIISATAILADMKAYPGVVAALLVYIVLAIVLLIRRKTIEPAPMPPQMA